MYQVFRMVMMVVLAAFLAVPTTLAVSIPAPVLPAGLEGVILDAVPAGWGELLAPLATEVPGLYVVVAQPYLALDPRAEAFRTRWEDREIDPTDWGQVADMLADPALQGATVLAAALVEVEEDTVELLGYVETSVQDGRYVSGDPVPISWQAFGAALRQWRNRLVSRINTEPDGAWGNEELAVQLTWYTLLSGDGRLLETWINQVLNAGEDCGEHAGSDADCEDCCEEDYSWQRNGVCAVVAGLGALGACAISTACGPLTWQCCAFSSTFVAAFFHGECQDAVRGKVRKCIKVCVRMYKRKKKKLTPKNRW